MEDPDIWKTKLGVGEVAEILGHNGRRFPGYCELDDVIVGLVAEIRSPEVVDPDPPAGTQESVQQGFPLFGIQR